MDKEDQIVNFWGKLRKLINVNRKTMMLEWQLLIRVDTSPKLRTLLFLNYLKHYTHCVPENILDLYRNFKPFNFPDCDLTLEDDEYTDSEEENDSDDEEEEEEEEEAEEEEEPSTLQNLKETATPSKQDIEVIDLTKSPEHSIEVENVTPVKVPPKQDIEVIDLTKTPEHYIEVEDVTPVKVTDNVPEKAEVYPFVGIFPMEEDDKISEDEKLWDAFFNDSM